MLQDVGRTILGTPDGSIVCKRARLISMYNQLNIIYFKDSNKKVDYNILTSDSFTVHQMIIYPSTKVFSFCLHEHTYSISSTLSIIPYLTVSFCSYNPTNPIPIQSCNYILYHILTKHIPGSKISLIDGLNTC